MQCHGDKSLPETELERCILFTFISGGSRGSYVSKILNVKKKESGPLGVGGICRARPLDPPMFIHGRR